MIVRLNKEIRSYYASPHTFTTRDPEQEVSAELGEYLLKTGYFLEVKSKVAKTKEKEPEKESTKKKTK